MAINHDTFRWHLAKATSWYGRPETQRLVDDAVEVGQGLEGFGIADAGDGGEFGAEEGEMVRVEGEVVEDVD